VQPANTVFTDLSCAIEKIENKGATHKLLMPLKQHCIGILFVGVRYIGDVACKSKTPDTSNKFSSRSTSQFIFYAQ
jgi:transposase-like protein